MSDALHIALAGVAAQFMETVSGKEFQRAALDVAAGYWCDDELDSYHKPDDLAQAVARELERLGPLSYPDGT